MKKTETPLIVETNKDTDVSTTNKQEEAGDFLKLLKHEFFYAPFLSLLELYLIKGNGKNRKIETCVDQYKSDYPITYHIIKFFDFFLRGLFLFIILIVVIRGLGLIDYILEVIQKIHKAF